MTRAMLGCTIVLTLGLTAHAQSFDPLYKPEPGDTVMVGWPESYGIPIGVGGMRAKLSFFGTIGAESPEMEWDMNRVSGHMEDGHTYLLKQGKRYRLHAGLKVKIIAKTRTVATLFNAQIVQEPLYEVEIAEGKFTGIHVYISGFALQQKARHLQDDWDEYDGVMHTGLVLEDDNPKLAIAQYRFAYSLSTNAKIRAAAKSKLAEAGVPLPKTMAEFMAKLGPMGPMEETKDKDNAEPKTSGFGKPLAAPKEDSEDLTVDLLDTSWEHSETGNYIYIYVKIRNTSGTTLKVLRVTATLEQQNNSIVSTAKDIMEPMTIAPNGTALAKLSCKANPLIHHYNLTFENADFKEVKFKNRTK